MDVAVLLALSPLVFYGYLPLYLIILCLVYPYHFYIQSRPIATTNCSLSSSLIAHFLILNISVPVFLYIITVYPRQFCTVKAFQPSTQTRIKATIWMFCSRSSDVCFLSVEKVVPMEC